MTEEEVEMTKRYNDLKDARQKAVDDEDEALATTIKNDMHELRLKIVQAANASRKKFRDELRVECKQDEVDAEVSSSDSDSSRSDSSSRRSGRRREGRSRSGSRNEAASKHGGSAEQASSARRDDGTEG